MVMQTWVEDVNKQLDYDDLLAFTKGLSRSQGSYGRIYEALSQYNDDEIDELNEKLETLGLKNELMTIINIFEG